MRLKRSIVLGWLDDPPESSLCPLLPSPSLWIIFCYSTCYLATCLYCSFAYSHDPTSFFFDPSKGYQRVYSLKREKQADAFINAAKRSTSQPSPPSSPSICLGIAIIARANEQYIPHTIGSLLEALTDNQRQSIHLTVFFAQTDPSQHPIYNEPWLKNVANEILQYKVSDEKMARLHSLEENHQFWNKSMFDNEYLLKNAPILGQNGS
ncbi:MAG: hypothetical protein Q9226_000476 [Calogaya cf. arnoldii]